MFTVGNWESEEWNGFTLDNWNIDRSTEGETIEIGVSLSLVNPKARVQTQRKHKSASTLLNSTVFLNLFEEGAEKYVFHTILKVY